MKRDIGKVAMTAMTTILVMMILLIFAAPFIMTFCHEEAVACIITIVCIVLAVGWGVVAICLFLVFQTSCTHEIETELRQRLEAAECIKYCSSRMQKNLDHNMMINILCMHASLEFFMPDIPGSKRIPYKWFRCRSKADQARIESLVAQVNTAKKEVEKEIDFMKQEYHVDFGIDFGEAITEYLGQAID